MSFQSISQSSTTSAKLSAFSRVAPFDLATLPTMIADLLVDARAAARQDRDAVEQRLGRAMELLQGERLRLLDETPAVAPAPMRGGLAVWQIRRIDAFIAQNLQGPLRVSDLAAIAKLSTSYFSKAFAQSYGVGAREHIIQKRLDRACEMMMSSRDPLAQISADCGFADQAHLSTRFRKAFGTSPHAWRRLHQRDAAQAKLAA
jgi:AraC family transcriptional regulator